MRAAQALADMVQAGVSLTADIGQGDLRDGGKAERLLRAEAPAGGTFPGAEPP